MRDGRAALVVAQRTLNLSQRSWRPTGVATGKWDTIVAAKKKAYEQFAKSQGGGGPTAL